VAIDQALAKDLSELSDSSRRDARRPALQLLLTCACGCIQAVNFSAACLQAIAHIGISRRLRAKLDGAVNAADTKAR
jgi:hypothetical protein